MQFSTADERRLKLRAEKWSI